MRNLILIFKTYQKFFFFLLLELICIVIFIRNNNYQFHSYLHSARAVSGSVYAKKKTITSYLNLESKNRALLKENAKLKSKLGIPLKNNPLKDTSFSQLITRDSSKLMVYYNYLPARVLNNSFDKKNNFLTLNIGSKQGVRSKMRVIGPHGVVGIITNVSANYSLAASVLSNQFRVSSVTPEGTSSTVQWGEIRDPYYAILSGISQSEKLKKGDTILTSPYSEFPPNIMIGRVVKKHKGNKYLIKLGTNFKNMDFVYIVDYQEDKERTLLENSVSKERNE